MKVSAAVWSLFILMCARAHAEVVFCLPNPPFGSNESFEVWQEPLPAPDYRDAHAACVARVVSERQLKEFPSPWLDSQRRIYSNALKKQRVDILVAPFQDQGYGLERTERAVMSADFAYHLDPDVRVADPFLTARALGDGARRYEQREIVELARTVGARTAVVGYVGHDREHRMTITIQVIEVDQNAAAGSTATTQRDWRSVPFTHADPPFVVFHRMLPSVLEGLSLPVAEQPRARAPVVFPDDVSFSFADVVSDSRPLGASLGLSLVGSMAASADARSQERLFERALVTSWHFDAPGADATFLRAYALLNLEHRPAALALINGATGAEFVALRAVLNGDLPGSAAALAKVRNPLKRAMLAGPIDDIRFRYQREDLPMATDSEAVFGDAAYDWLALAASRANDLTQWRVDESAVLKFLLDEVYPVAGLGVQSVLGGGLVVGARTDDVGVDLATMRHVGRFVESADVPVCCSVASAQPTAWDLVGMVEGRAEARMSKYLYLTGVVRAQPEIAADAIERYKSVFDGHPLFALAQADQAVELSEKATDEALQRLRREAREHAHNATEWAGGQNYVAHEGIFKLGLPSTEGDTYAEAYGFDYPRRPFWFDPLLRLSGITDPAEAERIRQALREEALPYARTEMTALPIVGPLSPERDKQFLLAELQQRFVGHSGHTAIVRMLRPRVSSGDPLIDARAEVEEAPEDWNARLSLGRKLIEQHGRWQEAADVMIAHPYFHSETPPQRVKVSNDAYEAGSLFYWGGHQELAIPFYEVAANLQTGAASQMTSEIRLNILAGRYRAATAGSYERAQRYPNAYAFRDFLSFLHALGYGEEAWDGFSQVASAYDNPQIWLSALVGQRREGLTEPEIRAWLKTPGIREARFRNQRFAPRYAVLVNASDHETPADLGALVEEIEGEPPGRVVQPGTIELPHPENPADTYVVTQSSFASGVPPPVGTRVKSEFAFLGAAYAAIRHGDYDAAVDEFQAMASYYPIERDPYSVALPYFAWAAAKAGRSADLEPFLNRFPGGPGTFDFDLARAFLHGARKETPRALELLDQALRVHPYTDHRPVLIEYQFAEACEWLYRETGEEAFRDALLAWIVSQQEVQPTHAWPYAMEYTYARTPERKLRALAMTLYLDPKSPRIRAATAAQRAEAEVWGAKNNLFLLEEDPPAEGGPTARLPIAPARLGG